MAAKLPLSRREFVKGTGGLLIGFAMREHAFDHPAAQPCGTARAVDKTGFVVDFERHLERRECRFRQSGAYQ